MNSSAQKGIEITLKLKITLIKFNQLVFFNGTNNGDLDSSILHLCKKFKNCIREQYMEDDLLFVIMKFDENNYPSDEELKVFKAYQF